jgi:hypothetical protein
MAGRRPRCLVSLQFGQVVHRRARIVRCGEALQRGLHQGRACVLAFAVDQHHHAHLAIRQQRQRRVHA